MDNPVIPASSLSHRNDYFSMKPNQWDNWRNTGIDMNSDDPLMGPSQISKVLKDMTGNDWFVQRIRYSDDNKDDAFSLLKKWAEDDEYGGYFIADIGGHFVNVTGYDHVSGELIIHDTSNKNRLGEDVEIKGFYFIESVSSRFDRQVAEKVQIQQDTNNSIIENGHATRSNMFYE